jgi:hypothetical protein
MQRAQSILSVLSHTVVVPLIVPLLLVAVFGCTDSNPAFRSDGGEFLPMSGGAGGGFAGSTGGVYDGASATTRVNCPVGAADLGLCLRCEGDLHDESGYAHPISQTGIIFVPGADGVACGCATNSKVSATLATLELTDFTIEAWVLARVLPAAGTRMGIVDRNGAVGIFLASDGSVSCTIPNGVGGVAPNAVKAGAWTSVTCMLGQGALSIWINGRQTLITTASNLSGAATTGSLTIGSNNPTGEPLDGAFDNVRIWRHTRTAAQICEAAIGCR